MNINQITSLKRFTKLKLAIPESQPRKTGAGHIFQAGETFKYLGTHGTLIRASRIGDNAKLYCEAEAFILAD